MSQPSEPSGPVGSMCCDALRWLIGTFMVHGEDCQASWQRYGLGMLRCTRRVAFIFSLKKLTVNQHIYYDVLKDHLLPFMEIHRTTKFLQDGTPCHKAKKVMDFLKEQPSRWSSGQRTLWTLTLSWTRIPSPSPSWGSWSSWSGCLTSHWTTGASWLCMYMPGRIQKVMGLKGDMTKYRNILFCVHKVLHLWFLIFLLFY